MHKAPSMTIFVTFFLILLFPKMATAAATDDFVIQVKTDNSGISGNTQFVIPTNGSGYNYSVDCNNDGSNEDKNITGNYTCNYPFAGTYTIRIKHDISDGSGFPRIDFSGGTGTNDRLKLVSLDQWGTSHWTSLRRAFWNAANMQTPATDSPNLTSVPTMDLSGMFYGACIANPDTSNWDTTNVIDMSYMFSAYACFPIGNEVATPDTSGWITHNVTSMQEMFAYQRIANPNTSGWNTAMVENMQAMFSDALLANPDTSNWDVGSVTNMKGVFFNASSAEPNTSNWNTESVTDMSYLFYGASMANPDTSSWDVSQVDTMQNFLSGVTIPTADYESMLDGFNNQILKSGVDFHGGNSEYCSAQSQIARASMINTDLWNIDDGGLCAPSTILDLTSLTDTGVSQTDNLTNINTPEFIAECSLSGNTLRLFSSQPTVNTLIASHVCASQGNVTISIPNEMTSGIQNITYTEQPSTDTASAHSAPLTINIDTTAPNTPNCTTIPSPANNGTPVVTTCTSVEVGSLLTINKMDCDFPTGASGIVICTGTVGTGAGQITVSDDTVIVTDTAGNSNTDATTGLQIDNTAPITPNCSSSPSPANNGTSVTTTCDSVEVGSTLSIDNMTCPAPTGATGVVSCTGTVGTGAGQITVSEDTVTVTDTAGNSNTDATTGLQIDNTAPIGPGELTAPENLTNDVNDDIIGSCGLDAKNGTVVVTSSPENGFSTDYGEVIALDSNGGFIITDPVWVEGEFSIHYDCTDEAGNGPTAFGLFGPITVDLNINAPIINPIATTHLIITGMAEPFAFMTISNAACTNVPIQANQSGDWFCEILNGLDEGMVVTVSAVDLAGNVSVDVTTTVLSVNVAPSFEVYCDIDATDVTGENKTTIQFPAFIYNMFVGPKNESDQTYNLSIDSILNGDPDGIVDSMMIDNSGHLQLSINTNNSGVATLEVTMVDDGGTLVGGQDTTIAEFNVHNYADLNLDPRYMHLDINDILYKNTFDTCRKDN